MPSGPELVAAIGIVVAAGAVSGFAGFGFALIAVPPLLLLFAPATVVAVTKVLNLSTSWVILAGEWEHLQRRTIAWLLPPAMLGLGAGYLVLRSVDPIAIKLLASSVVVAFALFLLSGYALPRIHSRRATWLTGLTSGVLSTSTGLSGPPVVVLLTARDLAPAAFRVTLTGYFTCIDVVGLTLLIAGRSVHRGDLAAAVVLIPAAIAGRAAGRWLATHSAPALFRRVNLMLLLLTGLSGLATALVALG